MSTPDSTMKSEPPRRSVRLIFEYEGDDVRLVSQQVVDVSVTGFDLADTRRPGDYVELRGADATALARVPVRGALSNSVEVFPEEPDGAISRVDVDRPSGAFTVVVPAPPETREAALVRVSAPTAGTPGIAAETAAPAPSEESVEELATFSLDLGE